jgi:hypothetical protein
MTSTGRAGSLYILSGICVSGLGTPGLRPLLSRSSWQVAQGQALRSQAKLQAL